MSKNAKVITYRMLLTNRRAVVAFLVTIFGIIFMLFFESILALRLKGMGLDEKSIGNYKKICFIYN